MYWVIPLILIPTAFLIWVGITIGAWPLSVFYLLTVGVAILWGLHVRRPPIADPTARPLTTVRIKPGSVRIDVTGVPRVVRWALGRPYIEIPLDRITRVHVEEAITRRAPGFTAAGGWIGRGVVIGTFLTLSGPSMKSWYAFRRGRSALVIDFRSDNVQEAVADVLDPLASVEGINAALAARP